MIACIKQKDIDKIADSIIQNERLKVSGISAALGAPGGAAMAATIPADIAQKKCQPIRTDILTVFIKNSLCLLDAQLVFFFVY